MRTNKRISSVLKSKKSYLSFEKIENQGRTTSKRLRRAKQKVFHFLSNKK